MTWPVVTAGANCLLVAPTGNGKTLAAFLPILGKFFEESVASGIRCVYVAPLKALCNDARKNLRSHIHQIAEQSNTQIFSPQLALRTGDTSSAAKKKIWTDPPDILLTTPESLALMLTHHKASEVFAALESVVVDEVHALACNKRGADLTVSLERLERLAGSPLQRIGLSATCAPVDTAARFLVGPNRDCTIAQMRDDGEMDLLIEPIGYRDADGSWAPQRFFWELVDRVTEELEQNTTTLVFTNTRALAERLAYTLRQRRPQFAEQIAVHHSSLAAKRRRVVERQLKRGNLRLVVTSTSLELGIDIGSVDCVVMVRPPGGAIRLLQRIGRAGHGPGQLRRGLILVAGPTQLLEAVVTAKASQTGHLEQLQVPNHPLDVLCQQLLGMAATEPWMPKDAYELVRGAYPFRNLPHLDFEACLEYLLGIDGKGREWLPARLRSIQDDGFATFLELGEAEEREYFTLGDSEQLQILRQNIGTILGEDPVTVQRADSTKIGEVDQYFAEQLQPGDRFLLDGQSLEYKQLLPETLVVEEVINRPIVPRWFGDGLSISRELAERLFAFRHSAADALLNGPDALAHVLQSEFPLDDNATSLLVQYFERQETLSQIPDAATLLVEAVGTDCSVEYSLHTPLHRPANDAIAQVLAQRLRRNGWRAQVPVVADLGILMFCESAREISAPEWRALLSPDGFLEELEQLMADGPTLRDRFRRVATTGLMLLRNPLGEKPKVGGRSWVERRLFERVQQDHPEFALLRQAESEVRQYCVDVDGAAAYLADMPNRSIQVRWLPCTSPFAENWTQSHTQPDELIGDPEEVLFRLHATLMGHSADLG